MTSFAVDLYQNEFLPVDGTEVNGIVTVTAMGGGPGGSADGHERGGAHGRAPAAEIVIVDTSGSMHVPRTKINAARDATSAAIDCIRDGVEFAVIAGTDTARVVYPRGAFLATADATTREQATWAASRLQADGGTAIGKWLTLARELFGTVPGRTCHAILLTDGENEHETAEQLDAALAQCEGEFQCDCRGVGTDWKVSELRKVASSLLGTADIIREPDHMADDFRGLIERAMGKATRSVSLRLWTPAGAEIGFVRQVAPAVVDLTDRGTALNAQTADYPTGAWGEESRDYHVCIRVSPHAVGEEMQAGRITLYEGDQAMSEPVRVLAKWTDDPGLSTRINRQVANYTGQVELAECIQEGLEAGRAGDEVQATVKLGRAVQLASETGNDDTMKLLQAVVDVQDAATGTIRLRRDVDKADEMALDTRSIKTVRVTSGP